MDKHVHIISAESILLANESASSVIKKAKKHGFLELKRFEIEAHFDWNSVLFEAQNIGLFSQKQIIDIRNPNNRCDAKATKAMIELAGLAHGDLFILFRFGKLTSTQVKSAWLKKLSANAKLDIIKTPLPAQLPSWINTRAKKYKLNLSQDAITRLSELTQGNLLALDQALQKCQLLNESDINADLITKVASDSAEFTVFDLADAMLSGDKALALRMVNQLKNQGVEPTLIAWSINKTLRELYNIQFALQSGLGSTQAMKGIWSSKQPLYLKALKRLDLKQLQALLLLCSKIDQTIKGIQTGNVNTLFESVIWQS